MWTVLKVFIELVKYCFCFTFWFFAMRNVRSSLPDQALKLHPLGWRGRQEGGSGWGTHVSPWLIHVNVWQKSLQNCKVISLQLIKINGKKKETAPPPLEAEVLTTEPPGKSLKLLKMCHLYLLPPLLIYSFYTNIKIYSLYTHIYSLTF